MQLLSPLTELKGVGAATKLQLSRLGLKTVQDLLLHIPLKYHDYSQITNVAEAEPGPVTLKGSLDQIKTRRSRKGLSITQARLSDETGKIGLLWFNQPYRAEQLKRLSEVYVSGELTIEDRVQLINAEVESSAVDQSFTAQIVPQYRLTKGLHNKKLYKLVDQILPLAAELEDYLPTELTERYKLLSIAQAVRQLHRPDSAQSLAAAEHRWGFDELFELMFSARLIRQQLQQAKAVNVPADVDLIKQFLSKLEFELTDDQKRALWQLIQDMADGRPMNRLLQGDVGSGKTVVAAAAARLVIAAGHQVAVVAPTEVVAQQHLQSFKQLLPDVNSVLLTSSESVQAKRRRKNQLQRSEAQLVVGTHAVLQPDVEFASLGLLVIDEQHRFGVKQRQALVGQSDELPHVLSMSATPIPRTLALTVYSDLDVTSIKQLPPGRKPVATEVYGPAKRQFVYDQLSAQLELGHQIYVVCPLISDSDKLGVTSVEKEHRRIADYFKSARVGQLHGGLKPDQKQQIIQQFTAGKIDILVSTTVVEVGVNVANANLMLIEGAERFGISQLHQLRGRVGRSSAQAYCYGLTSTTAQARNPRLRAFAATTDGFELAEYDMQHRGAGQLYGTAQSGQFSFQHARLGDSRLVEIVQSAIADIIGNDKLLNSPRLQAIIDKAPQVAQRN